MLLKGAKHGKDQGMGCAGRLLVEGCDMDWGATWGHHEPDTDHQADLDAALDG